MILAALALLAAACNREAVFPDQGHEQVIDFSAFFAQDATKAEGEKTAFAANKDSIGVFACYTGDLEYDLTSVTPDFMFNQDVTYDGSDWTYSPVKYWPNNSPVEHISFFSYYPYISSEKALKAKDGIIGFSKSYAKGDPWLVYRLPEAAPYTQTDLMYGVPHLNRTKQEASEKIEFTLKHALACIADLVTVQMSQELYTRMHDSLDISITGLRIVYSNLTTKARLVLNSPVEPVWKEVISGELQTSRTYTSEPIEGKTFSKAATTNPAAMTIDEEHGLFYIPLQIAGQDAPQAEITLFYTVTGLGEESFFNDSVVKVIEFAPGDASRKQNLALTLTENFNLEADIVTEEADGISMPEDLEAEYKNVTIDYTVPDTTFTYLGSVQQYIVPRTGTYQLEAWGAQGGKGVNVGAKGGYATAQFNFSIGDVLYVYVGGKGGDATKGASTGGIGGWNGGGPGGAPYGNYFGGGGGGGATHIAVSDIGVIGTLPVFKLSDYEGLEGHLLLVAGGGGGGAWKASSAGSGSGGGWYGIRGNYVESTAVIPWNNSVYSFGRTGGNGGSGEGAAEGNGGGGGGYQGGNAKTTTNDSDYPSTGGSGGSSRANNARYNYVTDSFDTYSSVDTGYPNPQYPAGLDDPGNGLVVITFVNPL